MPVSVRGRTRTEELPCPTFRRPRPRGRPVRPAAAPTSAPRCRTAGRSSSQNVGPLILDRDLDRRGRDRGRRRSCSFAIDVVLRRRRSFAVLGLDRRRDRDASGSINAALMVTRGRDARRRQGVQHRPLGRVDRLLDRLRPDRRRRPASSASSPGCSSLAFFGLRAVLLPRPRHELGDDALTASFDMVEATNFGRSSLVIAGRDRRRRRSASIALRHRRARHRAARLDHRGRVTSTASEQPARRAVAHSQHRWPATIACSARSSPVT